MQKALFTDSPILNNIKVYKKYCKIEYRVSSIGLYVNLVHIFIINTFNMCDNRRMPLKHNITFGV